MGKWIMELGVRRRFKDLGMMGWIVSCESVGRMCVLWRTKWGLRVEEIGGLASVYLLASVNNVGGQMILWDMREGSVEKLYLNNNEILHGVVFGMCFTPMVSLWSVPMAMITALLWSLSGANGHDKYWRRWVMPSVVCGATALCSWSLLPLVSIPLMAVVLSLGYGLVTYDPNLPDTITDEGSVLGRFAEKIFPGLEKKQEYLVRGIIYLLLLLASIPCLI